MLAKILIRRDTTNNWVNANPILGDGEFGIEKCVDGTTKIKVGNGVNDWGTLPYAYITMKEFENHISDLTAHGSDVQFQTLNNEINGIKNEIDVINEDYTSIKNDIYNIHNTNTAQSDLIESISTTVTQNHTELKNEVSTLNQGLSGVIQDVAINRKDIDGLEFGLGSAEIEIDAIKENIDIAGLVDTKTRVDAVENNITTVKNKVSGILAVNNEQKNRLLEHDADITNIKYDIHNLQTTDQEYRRELDAIHGTIGGNDSDYRADISNVKYDIEKLEKEDISIKTMINDIVDGDIGGITEGITDIQLEMANINSVLGGRITSIAGEVDTIQTTLDSMNNKIDVIEEVSKNDIDTIQTTLENMNNKIDNINIEEVSNIIAIRGGVKTYASLPDISGERIGDAYIVEQDENNNGISIIYAVTETGGVKQWIYVAQFIVDLTNYYTKEEIQELFLDKYYTNDEIDNKLVIIEDKIVLLNTDLLNYYTKQVIDDKVNTIDTEVTTHNTNTTDAHGIDTIKNDISDLKTKVANIDVISIKGSVDTFGSLPDNTDLLIGTAYIVENDENKNNITTIYAVEDNAGIKEWVFIGEFKVDLSNYYNKSEVDELVEDVDLTDYYNKEQINNKLEDYNISVNGLLTMGPPDYSAATGENLMYPSLDTWTSDFDGYLRVFIEMNGVFNTDSSQTFKINGISLFTLLRKANTPASVVTEFVDIFPVKKGDVCTWSFNSTWNNSTAWSRVVYKIPSVINPPVKLEAQPLLDYSTAEQDTGRKWIDGKVIYQKTYNFTVSQPRPTSYPAKLSQVVDAAFECKYIIKGELVFDVKDGGTTAGPIIGVNGGAAVQWMAQNHDATKDFRFILILDNETLYNRWNGQQYWVTIWYTK